MYHGRIVPILVGTMRPAFVGTFRREQCAKRPILVKNLCEFAYFSDKQTEKCCEIRYLCAEVAGDS
jgi:hypothetical protein